MTFNNIQIQDTVLWKEVLFQFAFYLQTCGNNLIGVCKSEEDVTKEKDEQLKTALIQIKENIPNWDSDKCPAMK